MGYKTFRGEDPSTYYTTFTVEEAINQIGLGRFHVRLILIAGLLLYAEDMTVMLLSLWGPELKCEWHITSAEEAMLTSAFFVGMFVGSPFMGCMADRYGRKTTMIFSSVWTIYGFILLACTTTYHFLLMLLALTGVGLSGSVVSLTYFAEFIPTQYRGRLMLLLTAYADTGTFLEVLFAFTIPYIGWQAWLILSLAPLIIFLLLVSTLPESPRYLLAMGRHKEATAIIEKIAEENKSLLPMGKLVDVPPVQQKDSKGNISKPTCFSGLFWWIADLKTWLLILIFFTMEFAFYGIILLSTQLISSHPLHPMKTMQTHCFYDCMPLGIPEYMLIMWTTTAELPAVLGVFVIDRIGRKLSLGLSCCVAALGFLCLMLSSGPYWLIVTLIFITWAASAEAYQVMLIYASEVYPLERRAQGLGLVSAAGRIGVLCTPFCAIVMYQEHSKFAATATYSAACFLATFAAFMLPIETSGKSLDEME